MTPADTAASYGIRLVRVKEITNIPKSTLYDWHKEKPLMFEAICKGAKAMQDEKQWVTTAWIVSTSLSGVNGLKQPILDAVGNVDIL